MTTVVEAHLAYGWHFSFKENSPTGHLNWYMTLNFYIVDHFGEMLLVIKRLDVLNPFIADNAS